MKCETKPVAMAVSTAIALLPLMSEVATAATYAPWLTQMGVNDVVVSAANWGKNQLLGVVDTGIVASNSAFSSGKVSASLSTCAAVSFKCANGYVDDHGHGTAVAEIAAGNKTFSYNSNYGGYTVVANSVISMATNANIVAMKSLSASGSGYSTDIASGVRKAADAGASVINVSITYGNSADIVSAINYAASKGAFIVWSGGNSAQKLLNGASTNGLTAAAISHLILVGSVSSKNVVSSFSNTPGSGTLADTRGGKSSYASRWIMAPGEAILAPIATSGSNAWGYWTGTSMSAPFASGSLLLLQSAWPILKTMGTTANLLLATASDLGNKGVDSAYGNGIVNLTTAFQPYGALTVTRADGSSIPVSSLTTSMITGGALGGLTSVQSKLANYMAFDGYVRNFGVNLSGLIKTPATVAQLNPLPTNINTGPTAIKLANGSEIAYMQAPASNPAETLGVFGFNPDAPHDMRTGYAMLTDKDGMTTAIGYGFPVQFSYAKALYGNDDIAHLASQQGVANLSDLAQGGGLFAYGMSLNDGTRMALSWSGSASVSPWGTAAAVNGASASWGTAWTYAKASNFGFGVSHRFGDRFTGGVNVGFLNESHGVLGSLYDSNSALSLGDANRSTSLGFSATFNLARHSSLLVEAGFATTANSNATGLLAGTKDIQSRSYGMTFMSKHLLEVHDRLTLAMIQPLRVISGEVALVTPGIDAEGVPSYSKEWVSLVPNGRARDYKLSYDIPLRGGSVLPPGKFQSVTMQICARKDMQNISGNNEASAGLIWRLKF